MPHDIRSAQLTSLPVKARPSTTDSAESPPKADLPPEGRPRLIFRQHTAVGSVTVWKSRRASSVIYDLHVAELHSDREVQRQRIVRPASDHPLKHVLMSLDGEQSFIFEQQGDGNC